MTDPATSCRHCGRRIEQVIRHQASRMGRSLGNWNDRHNATGDRTVEHPRRWHVLDRVARWLYVLDDPPCSRCHADR
jgi:hypothetical protein